LAAAYPAAFEASAGGFDIGVGMFIILPIFVLLAAIILLATRTKKSPTAAAAYMCGENSPGSTTAFCTMADGATELKLGSSYFTSFMTAGFERNLQKFGLGIMIGCLTAAVVL
jgi:hypothetical protein